MHLVKTASNDNQQIELDNHILCWSYIYKISRI